MPSIGNEIPMPKTVKALVVSELKAPLESRTIERRDLGPHDVRIDIKFAGICHSDIHQGRAEWGGETFPMVPGHEIAGVVAEIGSDVTKFQVGDRVGVGCGINSCRKCDNCARGLEQYCVTGMVMTYNDTERYTDGAPTYGGYSEEVVVNEDYVLRIPDGLELDVAAPLLCAGITTYSPLRRWNVGPGTRVAVVGMGGLGHVAVRLAKAMGAEVTVLSQGLSKQDDGLRFGATGYYATSDPNTFQELRSSFDLILNTVSAPLDVNHYLSLLATDGTMVYLGLPVDDISFRVFSLITNRRSISGSTIGGIPETQEMLDFAAEHGIGAEIETIRADQVNEAWDRVVASDVKYRFVIDTSTL